MEPLKRYIPIDYSKYAPDIPEDQLETYYGAEPPTGGHSRTCLDNK